MTRWTLATVVLLLLHTNFVWGQPASQPVSAQPVLTKSWRVTGKIGEICSADSETKADMTAAIRKAIKACENRLILCRGVVSGGKEAHRNDAHLGKLRTLDCQRAITLAKGIVVQSDSYTPYRSPGEHGIEIKCEKVRVPRSLRIEGAPGRAPKHQVDPDNHQIRWQNPDGSWGNWLKMPKPPQAPPPPPPEAPRVIKGPRGEKGDSGFGPEIYLFAGGGLKFPLRPETGDLLLGVGLRFSIKPWMDISLRGGPSISWYKMFEPNQDLGGIVIGARGQLSFRFNPFYHWNHKWYARWHIGAVLDASAVWDNDLDFALANSFGFGGEVAYTIVPRWLRAVFTVTTGPEGRSFGPSKWVTYGMFSLEVPLVDFNGSSSRQTKSKDKDEDLEEEPVAVKTRHRAPQKVVRADPPAKPRPATQPASQPVVAAKDSDGDGVNDDEDLCEKVYGTDTVGCPEDKAAEDSSSEDKSGARQVDRLARKAPPPPVREYASDPGPPAVPKGPRSKTLDQWQTELGKRAPDCVKQAQSQRLPNEVLIAIKTNPDGKPISIKVFSTSDFENNKLNLCISSFVSRWGVISDQKNKSFTTSLRIQSS